MTKRPKNLGDYGLKEPVIEVSFKSKGDKAFRTLQLGTKTPTGSDMYAKLANEKKVFLVQGYLESTFNRQPFDLRDKKILSIDRDKVDRLEVVNGDSTLAADQGRWRLEARVARRGPRRLRHRRRPGLAPAVGRDEVDRRGERDGPEAVRPRQAGRAGHHRSRKRSRPAGARREDGQGRRVRARPEQDRWWSPWRPTC